MKIKTFAAVVAAFSLAIGSCSGPATKSVELFNGQDLSGWNFVVDGDSVPASDVFAVKDGEICIAGQPFGYMYTENKYRNYELDVEWAWPGEPANSGIFLIIADPTNPFPNGVECQLKAGSAGDFVLLGGSMVKEYQIPEEGLPKFPVVARKEASSEKPVGEWNHAHIIVNEGHITVYVNDVLQNEATDLDAEGYIGLQSEGGPIKFRKVTITPAE